MTAIVGILNRHGVAMATDSAITIRNSFGNKVINNANKLFSLSKYEPLGVMLYGNASFAGTPWDVIIKIYRKQLGQKTFHTLNEYVTDFISYLYKNNFYSDKEKQDVLFSKSINDIFKKVESDVINNLGNSIDDKNKDVINQKLKEIFDQYTSLPIKDRCEGLKKYSFEDFIRYSSPFFETFYNNVMIKKGCDKTLLNSYINFYFHHLCDKGSVLFPFTGIVFSGYGESEYYPSIIEVRAYQNFDGNRFRYAMGLRDSISDKNPAGVYPFAQTNVMRNILEGIDPQIRQVIDNNFVKFAQGLIRIIQTQAIQTDATPFVKALEKVDIKGIYQGFVKAVNDGIQKHHTGPLINTVEYLEKEDLAEMAESLVSLTYLNKRMTSSEETVGGPVDVAAISKGDGFVWIKRKLYFPSDLNPHYINRYFKNNNENE